jgi:hypothetical protein
MSDAEKAMGYQPGWPARILSPPAMVVVAVALALPYLIGHLLGWREYTSFVCGTLPANDMQLLLGMVYIVSHFTFVLAVPVLVLGAAIFALLQRVAGKW